MFVGPLEARRLLRIEALQKLWKATLGGSLLEGFFSLDWRFGASGGYDSTRVVGRENLLKLMHVPAPRKPTAGSLKNGNPTKKEMHRTWKDVIFEGVLMLVCGMKIFWATPTPTLSPRI